MKAQRSLRVAHLTSAHPRHDVRIFMKECRSLATAGHEVHLVVADDAADEVRDGVHIHGVGLSRGRLARATEATRRVLRGAMAVDADVYHLHDPELLPVAAALKARGTCVVFDAHEDLPKQVMGKHYIPGALRGLLSTGVRAFERSICRSLDAIVTATPVIRDKFLGDNPVTIDINNYPWMGELDAGPDVGWPQKRREVCFIGGMTSIRGVRELVQAMALSTSSVTLVLGGTFQEPGLEAALQAEPGWARTRAAGQLGRAQVREVLSHAMAGLVTFLPLPNHVDAQPNKMFEYMSAGLPVIASHFPLWREIIEGNDCGLCVDPQKPAEIAAAIDRLVSDPALARRLGDNGRAAVRSTYNWEAEQNKLIGLYDRLPARRLRRAA
jgi:glycosyltransferase involved in cell wall biosynthesis